MKNTKKFWNVMSTRYDSQVCAKYVEAYNKTIEITKKFWLSIKCCETLLTLLDKNRCIFQADTKLYFTKL